MGFLNSRVPILWNNLKYTLLPFCHICSMGKFISINKVLCAPPALVRRTEYQLGYGPSSSPMHLGLKIGPLCPLFRTRLQEPCSFDKVPDGPTPSTLISSGSRKKEPRCICRSEAKASHSHKTCTEDSSSAPHFLQVGLSLDPITCRCRRRVLRLVSRPITALDCVLLKDNNWAPVARSGPEFNSRACLCVLQGPCHNARCWFFIQHFNFLLIFCLEPPIKGSGPINCGPEPLFASLMAISFPLTPAWPGTQYSFTACQAERPALAKCNTAAEESANTK